MALYFPAPKWDGTYEEMAKFGHNREGGARLHGGCDLYAPLESDVVAVDAGIVIEISGPGFAGETEAISIRHEGIGIIRYGEVVKIPKEFLRLEQKLKMEDWLSVKSDTQLQNSVRCFILNCLTTPARGVCLFLEKRKNPNIITRAF